MLVDSPTLITQAHSWARYRHPYLDSKTSLTHRPIALSFFHLAYIFSVVFKDNFELKCSNVIAVFTIVDIWNGGLESFHSVIKWNENMLEQIIKLYQFEQRQHYLYYSWFLNFLIFVNSSFQSVYISQKIWPIIAFIWLYIHKSNLDRWQSWSGLRNVPKIISYSQYPNSKPLPKNDPEYMKNLVHTFSVNLFFCSGLSL